MSQLITHITDQSFEQEVTQSTIPVLVDFWAEWCSPCRAIAPILDEVAVEFTGKIKIVKLNVDENNVTAQKLGVRGIPTLMLFKAGELEATKVGGLSRSQLAAFINSHL